MMGQILVDGIDDAVIAALRDRASRHSRSLETEARAILEERAARPYEQSEMTKDEIAARWEELRRKSDESLRATAGMHHTDSAILVRESRDEA
jgi:plasmid stability protein